METMTEAEVVAKFGPIRFYEIEVAKKMGRNKSWFLSQTVRCYFREELDGKLAELEAKAPSMTNYRHRKDVHTVRLRVFTAIKGYERFKRYARYGSAGNLQDLKPIIAQEISTNFAG